MRTYSKNLNPGEHGGWHTIVEGSVSSVASFDVLFRQEDWHEVVVYISEFLPSTSTENFELLLSNNSATFATGASAYSYSGFVADTTGTLTGFGATATNRIRCTSNNPSAATGRENDMTFSFTNPAYAAPRTVRYEGNFYNQASGDREYFAGVGSFLNNSGISGMRVQLDNGSNISTARYRAIGIKR